MGSWSGVGARENAVLPWCAVRRGGVRQGLVSLTIGEEAREEARGRWGASGPARSATDGGVGCGI